MNTETVATKRKTAFGTLSLIAFFVGALAGISTAKVIITGSEEMASMGAALSTFQTNSTVSVPHKATSRTPDGKMPGESKSSPREIQNYLGRISGPLLDRIDLHVEVPQVKFREISGDKTGETSAQIRERVIAARKIQQKRFAHKPKITCNARLGPKELKEFCTLDDATKEMLKMAMTELNFSARAYDRILKVARTIADLAGSENILSEHISEAIQYRSLDRQLWT